jgi:transposase-like protein
MPKSRPPYPAEFKQRIVELVRKGGRPRSWGGSSSRRPRRSGTG